ncbi:MAG: hypothetical protein LLG04_09860 [Parachlamydia sp.]|nr:hypothetical protein [Parachlamydia sp.]
MAIDPGLARVPSTHLSLLPIRSENPSSSSPVLTPQTSKIGIFHEFSKEAVSPGATQTVACLVLSTFKNGENNGLTSLVGLRAFLEKWGEITPQASIHLSEIQETFSDHVHKLLLKLDNNGISKSDEEGGAIWS